MIREHILKNCLNSNIQLEAINIQPEHVHAIINLPSDRLLKDIVKTIKGEASYFINSNNLCKKAFAWGRGYGAFSLGKSQFEIVKAYVRNQDKHHQKRSFTEEWNILLKKYELVNKE